MGFGSPPQGYIATAITIAVLTAAGLFSGANTWTGAQTFSHTLNMNVAQVMNFSGHIMTQPSNTGTPGLLNNTQTWNGNNTMKFGSGGIIQRNPASTFTTTWTGPAVLSNQTYVNYGQPLANFTSGQLSGNATGTSSTTIVMLGNYATLTPQQDGRVELSMSGYAQDSILGDGCRIDIRYGTSNLGASGAIASGTVIGNKLVTDSFAASAPVPFSRVVDITGLTIGTKYYFDVGQAAVTGGTCTLFNVNWSIKEI